MPRTPKATDGEAPKKRTRKTTTETDTGTNVVKAKQSAASPAKPKVAKAPAPAETVVETAPSTIARPPAREVVQISSLEERVRIRAYEIYLRRDGNGGSPEQDWFQAMAEVYGESIA